MSIIEQVKNFHTTFGHPAFDEPHSHITAERSLLRYRLLDEECGELAAALDKNDIVEVADALADIVYVAVGAAWEFGVAYQVPVFDDADVDLGTPNLEGVEVEDFLSDLRSSTRIFERLHHPVIAAAALTEIINVTFQLAWSFGIKLTPVLDEVHESNMAKVWDDGLVHYDAFGKVLKPAGWVAPDVAGVLGVAA